MSATPPPPANANAPVLSEEEKARQEQWKEFEKQLTKAQGALQQPMVDVFVRSDAPQKEWTVMDLKETDGFLNG